ncbi:MAG: 3-hydroxybutyrate oligomer hydrolase family protein [Pseudomonadota bacterium]
MRRIALLAVLAACSPADEPDGSDRVPEDAAAWRVLHAEAPATFDGETDDLLTGGLGLAGLRSLTAPSDASLRTLAVHYNFRAIVDVTDAGGFGRLTGPAAGEAKTPGTEYLALLELEAGGEPFSVAVQIPEALDREDPCLVIGPSSGSRGVYGAIGTASAFGLPRGCAVALTDKMTGGGVYHLATDQGYALDFRLAAGEAEDVLFRPDGGTELADYAARQPDALAVKHAHSKDNVQQYWGATVLAAGEYAFDVLNAHFDTDEFTPASTIVLAASISNGGYAVLAAAEQDGAGFLDGVVASEPNVTLTDGETLDLLTYAAEMNLYAPCAALAPENVGRPGAAAIAAARRLYETWCARLVADGRLPEGDDAAAPRAAMERIRAAGFLPQTDDLLNYGLAIRLWPAVSTLYTNAFGAMGVEDEFCGVRYAYATPIGTPRAPTAEEKRTHAALSSGSPPVAGVGLVSDPPTFEAAYDATVCFYEAAAGANRLASVEAGARAVRLKGQVSAPTIVLHGRADALIPVTQSSRPYAAKASAGAAPFAYYEIEHGQHFDAFLPLPDLSDKFVPMHVHFEAAGDLMLDHLRAGAPLPPSQVVRTTPRAPGAPLADANVPPIAAEPGPESRIDVADGRLSVPD